MHYDEIRTHFKRVRHCADGEIASCPTAAHPDGDRNPGMTLKHAGDKTLLNCHAGCSVEDILASVGLEMADLFDRPLERHEEPKERKAGKLTLAEFAEKKALPVEFLKRNGVEERSGRLIFHYYLANGQQADRHRIRFVDQEGNRQFRWSDPKPSPAQKADDKKRATYIRHPYGLQHLAASKSRTLALVEGESDSLTLWFYGITALGVPGKSTVNRTMRAEQLERFDHVIVVKENDKPDKLGNIGSDTFVQGARDTLGALCFEGDITVVNMAHAGDGIKDVSDLHVRHAGDPGGFEAEWAELLASGEHIRGIGLRMDMLDDVDEEDYVWLWQFRAACGHLTVFVGESSIGKSFITCDMASRISRGTDWPDGAKCEQGDVMIFAAEDGTADTIKPRVRALGGDMRFVHVFGRVAYLGASGTVEERQFSIITDIPYLERKLRAYPNTKAIFIDPISSYMAGLASANSNTDVRIDVFDRLQAIAEKYKIAVIAVTHFNKPNGDGGNPLDRIAGSIAFGAAPRIVWGFARDSEDDKLRLMALAKTNIGPEINGLGYRIWPIDDATGEIVREPEEGKKYRRATLEWELPHEPISLRDLLTKKDRSEAGKLEQAAEILRRMVSEGGGACDSQKIVDECATYKISASTVKRARKMLGYIAKKVGDGWETRRGE